MLHGGIALLRAQVAPPDCMAAAGRPGGWARRRYAPARLGPARLGPAQAGPSRPIGPKPEDCCLSMTPLDSMSIEEGFETTFWSHQSKE